MKVKVDGMSGKPEIVEDTISPEVCVTEDHNIVVTRDDLQSTYESNNARAGDVDVDTGHETLGHQDYAVKNDNEAPLDLSTEPVPPPRTDSTTLPIPPPRTDSATKPISSPHSVSPRCTGSVMHTIRSIHKTRMRQMIDRLGGHDAEVFSWDVQREYLLTCIGFVNGLGCLLKGPTLMVKHGGGVFFVAYVVCMLVCGCPLVYLDTTLGQYANGGPLKAWKVIPLFQGIGYSMVCTTFVMTSHHVMEMTWGIYYFGVALATVFNGRQLPWASTNWTDYTCDNLKEVDYKYLISKSLSSCHTKNHYLEKHSFEYMKAIKYFYLEALQLAPSIANLGTPVWYLVLCLLFAWVCVFATMIYGPSSIGKVMYVAALYPFVTVPVLFIFICFKDGSITGIKYFLSPEWSKLADMQIWHDAGMFMIQTLGLGTGCLHSLAGYTHFHSHCLRNLILMCVCNICGMFFGGLSMMSAVGILSNMTHVPFLDFSFTEYELGYALFPYILTNVSSNTALSLLFFSVIFVTGYNTLVMYVQTLLGALVEHLDDCGIVCTQARRWVLQLILCLSLTMIGIVFTTKGGLYAVHFLDHFAGLVCPCIVVLLECCILMYIFGARRFVSKIEDMTGHKNAPWWTFHWKFLTPCVLMALMSFTIMFTVQLCYRDIKYPNWSEILGWSLSIIPLLSIPICALWAYNVTSGTFSQRIKILLTTPYTWEACLDNDHEHNNIAPDYVICQPDNHRPMHGLAMLTANLYIPHVAPFSAEEIPPEGSHTPKGFLPDLVTIASTDTIATASLNQERGSWRGKIEYLLSCTGYIVGLGNIWRFPYIVYSNGGGAFFIPYLTMLIFCGIPLVYMEMAFGQYASLGPVTIWRAVPILKGVGYSMVITVSLLSVYYNVINAWAFHYLFASFTANLPWANCDNSWNTAACSLNKYHVTNCSLINITYLEDHNTINVTCLQDLRDCIRMPNRTHETNVNITECISGLFEQFGEAAYVPEKSQYMSNLKNPSEEYFFNNVLNVSEGLGNLGDMRWQLALYLLLCWGIVFVSLVKGVYSAGKVAYIIVIVPVIILVTLLICAMTVEGHLDGIQFYMTPKWDKLLDMKVWSTAATQVFFSLSACSGGLTTAASYSKFKNNICRAAILICVADTLFSVLAGFTLFASLGILAHELNTTVDNVVSSNISLVFVAFPSAVLGFKPAAVWSAFFFLMIIMMGISTILVTTEMIVTVIIDENKDKLHKMRVPVLIFVCAMLYLLGLPMATRGGSFLLHLLDEFLSGLPQIVIGMFMCIGIVYIYKIHTFCTDLRLMTGQKVSWWWKILWRFVTPAITIFILVSAVIGDIHLDTKTYPAWAEPLGIGLVILSIISIPAYAAKIIFSKRGTFIQRVKLACASEDNWGPALARHWTNVEYYPAVNTNALTVDMEQTPVDPVTDHVDFCTSEMLVPKLSEAVLLMHKQVSPKRPRELRQQAIINHAYSNPQCHISNGSIDQIKPRWSSQDPVVCPSDILVVARKKVKVPCQDVATQTDARSFTMALKYGMLAGSKLLKQIQLNTGSVVLLSETNMSRSLVEVNSAAVLSSKLPISSRLLVDVNTAMVQSSEMNTSRSVLELNSADMLPSNMNFSKSLLDVNNVEVLPSNVNISGSLVEVDNAEVLPSMVNWSGSLMEVEVT